MATLFEDVKDAIERHIPTLDEAERYEVMEDLRELLIMKIDKNRAEKTNVSKIVSGNFGYSA